MGILLYVMHISLYAEYRVIQTNWLRMTAKLSRVMGVSLVTLFSRKKAEVTSYFLAVFRVIFMKQRSQKLLFCSPKGLLPTNHIISNQ